MVAIEVRFECVLCANLIIINQYETLVNMENESCDFCYKGKYGKAFLVWV